MGALDLTFDHAARYHVKASMTCKWVVVITMGLVGGEVTQV